MANNPGGFLPSVIILGAFAAIALFLTFSRNWADRDKAQFRAATQLAALTILAQSVHFIEELLTGFYEKFPALFGFEPMSVTSFTALNIAWLLTWALSTAGLAGRLRVTLFPLWFLSIACIANSVAHPAFSVLIGGYFPGLVTSPFIGILGVLLFRRLHSLTYATNANYSASTATGKTGNTH